MIKTLMSALFPGRGRRTERWAAQPAAAEESADARQNSTRSMPRRRAGILGSGDYRRSIPPRTLIAACGLAAAGAFGFFALSPAPGGSSRLEQVPNMNSTPGGERQRESERYRETLRSSNVINAEAAERHGNSFVAVPEGLPEQSPRLADGRSSPAAAADPQAPNLTARQAAERVAAAAVTPAQLAQTDSARAGGNNSEPVSAAEEDNPFEAAILRQMSAVTRAMEPPAPGGAELIADANSRDMAWSAGQADAPQASAETSAPAIASGDIFTGELITMIDSDVTAPAAVRMTSGPAAGGVLIGGFAANSRAGGVVMEFTRLALPSGEEISVQAMALDQSTLSGAVRGEVNSRPAQRYGPTLVSSFVSGFAASAARPATTILHTANGIIAASEKPSIEDSLIAGAGQAASAAASDMEQAAPDTPRIRVYPGATVSILFLSPVPIPETQ